MSAGHAEYDSNRLPWLSDTAAPVAQAKPKASPVRYFLGGVVAAFLIAGLSYWFGLRSLIDRPQPASEVSVSLPLPGGTASAASQPREDPGVADRPVMPQVVFVPQPAPVVIRQTVPVPVADEAAPADAAAPAGDAATAADTAAASADLPASPPQVQPAPAAAAPLRLWPADVSEGASGRAVRIGTYSSRLQAKKAWSKLVRVYPGIRRLKAVVAPVPSVRNGKTYYRLQFGTTSHAHSAVLCQRMRIVGQNCVVIGAPQAGGSAAS